MRHRKLLANRELYNRWFGFTATTTEALVEIKTGGDDGSLRYGMVALWDDSGTELACGRYASDYGDIKMGYTALVPGNTYYISVDNHGGTTSYSGSFTLCMDDEVDYDYPLGAVELTDLNNWCSPEAAYTTINARAIHSPVHAGHLQPHMTGGSSFRQPPTKPW